MKIEKLMQMLSHERGLARRRELLSDYASTISTEEWSEWDDSLSPADKQEIAPFLLSSPFTLDPDRIVSTSKSLLTERYSDDLFPAIAFIPSQAHIPVKAEMRIMDREGIYISGLSGALGMRMLTSVERMNHNSLQLASDAFCALRASLPTSVVGWEDVRLVTCSEELLNLPGGKTFIQRDDVYGFGTKKVYRLYDDVVKMVRVVGVGSIDLKTRSTRTMLGEEVDTGIPVVITLSLSIEEAREMAMRKRLLRCLEMHNGCLTVYKERISRCG